MMTRVIFFNVGIKWDIKVLKWADTVACFHFPDTIKTIQRVGIVAGVFLGLSFVAGIIFLVLNILKKLAKPICFAAVTAPALSFISSKWATFLCFHFSTL